VETVISDFEDLANYKQITIEKDGNTSLIVQMNNDLAHILFTNLVKNALIHNHSGGKIIIRYSAGSISIANSGSDAIVNVFDRYRSALAGEKSSGLGLSIVKSISGLYRIHIAYDYDKMHIFTLSFPHFS
jgi:signal transduction histidine kinase